MKQPLTDGKALEPEAKGSWKSDSFEEKKDALIGWSYLSIQRWKVWEKQELGIKAGGAGVVAIAVKPPKQAQLWFGEEGPVTALCLPLGVWAIWDGACFHAVCECTYRPSPVLKINYDLREWTNVLLTNENFRRLCGRWKGTSSMGYFQFCHLLHPCEKFPSWS